MDPLSAAASVIALVQAAAGIAKVTKVLYGFSKARDEFWDLFNELATLHSVVHDIQSSLDALPQQDGRLPIQQQQSLQNIIAELNQTTQDLETLSQRMLSCSKGRNKDGLHRISRIQWQRLKGKVQELRDKARCAREKLLLCFSTLHVSQGAQSTHAVLEIKGIMETFFSVSAQRHAESVSLIRDQQAELVRSLRMLEMSTHDTARLPNQSQKMLENTHENTLALKRRPADEGINVESQLARVMATSNHSERSSSSIMCFQTELKQRCPYGCNCQCHKRSTVQAPSWLRPIMGAFSVNYNSIPILSPRPCNLASCRSNSKTSIHLQYYFPSWLLARGMLLAISWSSLTGEGASLHLRIPVVIGRHRVWHYIAHDKVSQIQDLLVKQKISPNSVDERGQSLLLNCLRMRSDTSAKLLLEAGCNISLNSEYGTATAFATYRLLRRRSTRARTGPLLKPEKEYQHTLRRIAGDEDVLGLNLLRDSILGLKNAVPLDLALSADPSSIDTVDSVGLPPLSWAIEIENEEAVEFLIAQSASLEARGLNGRNLLTQAASRRTERGLRIARSLIRAGCSPNSRDLRGRTALHYVEAVEMVELLLEEGADPNLQDVYGKSPLHYLARPLRQWPIQGLVEAAQRLIAAGADVNSVDNAGRTPLHTITESYQSNMAMMTVPLFRCLHQAGAILRLTTRWGQSLLHNVARFGHAELLEYLRGAEAVGIDPDLKDGYGTTPSDDIYRLRDIDPELLVRERKPTPWEVLSFTLLIVEIRERNWKQGHFLYSRTDSGTWDLHLWQKAWAEEPWRHYAGNHSQNEGGSDWEDDNEGGYEDEDASSYEEDGEGEYENDEEGNYEGEGDRDHEGDGCNGHHITKDEGNNETDKNDHGEDEFDNSEDNDGDEENDVETDTTFPIAMPHWLRHELKEHPEDEALGSDIVTQEEVEKSTLGHAHSQQIEHTSGIGDIARMEGDGEESDVEDLIFYDALDGS
ncbi:hypothetical protein B0H66DRAFT_558129 [Apodospora peruviana]|uniref:Fungal N-terminal domain-containing protein n=1 Tax=Apodospora peruviana TaxID=516989 RepID=A0AAE0M4B8_9PEZI|nr:hypothetical protein B0H66DRAFT_558129 [Apodospora peruviana]